MDNFMDNVPSILSVVGLFLTAVYGPKAVAKIQGKQKMKEVRMEGDSKSEELYTTHVERMLDRYERQLIQVEADFKKRLSEQEIRFNKRFDELKQEMEAEKEKERVYYLSEIEKRDDQIDELEKIVDMKEKIIVGLKGVE